MADEIIKCTKNDEWQVAICKCPDCASEIAKQLHYGASDPVIITDKDLVTDKIRSWSGFVFKCPNCGEEAIMPPGKGCMNCLTAVTIQSNEVTDYIKSLNPKRAGR